MIGSVESIWVYETKHPQHTHSPAAAWLQPNTSSSMNNTQCRKQKVQPRIMAENLQQNSRRKRAQQRQLCAYTYIWIHVKHFYYICSNQFRLILQVILGKIENWLSVLYFCLCVFFFSGVAAFCTLHVLIALQTRSESNIFFTARCCDA